MSQPGAPTPRVLRELSAKLEKYKLLGILGAGGMGQLFLARHEGPDGSGKLLVIKRMFPALAGDAQSVLMFLDEARIASTLQHANIVQSYDVDVVDGELFLAMEFLHGRDASVLLRRASSRGVRIPLETAVAVAVAVAAGLHYAHEKRGADGRPLGIVHRDISPQNVILTFEGDIKLIDFGVAKSSNNLTRTRLGVFKGKVAYASPEQCQGGPVDRRSDLFSLGVLLFELSTGRVLFPQNNELAVMKAITEGTIPRPSESDSTYPPELERIVLRALAREPSERYATAQEMQRDLEGFARQHHLDLSPASLVELLQTLFRDDVDAWKMARDVSTTLEQHIVRSRTRGRGQADGELDEDGDAGGRSSARPFEPADRNRSPADELAMPIPPGVLSSEPPQRPEARGGGWIVVGLSAAIVAAVVAFAAPRIFSGSGPSPNAETRLQEAEEDLLKAQETIREIEETLPCEPPSCASGSAVLQPPPVPKPAEHEAPEKVPPRGH
jgi:serine/threonine protein kinase